MDWESTATRELRAKNPLGLSTGKISALFGSTSEDNELGDHLAIFPTTQLGINAAAAELLFFYFYQGINTPEAIGDKWAGDKTGGYGKSICEIMKQPAGTTLDDKPGQVCLLMRAIADMENDDQAAATIPAEMFWEAVTIGQLS